MAALIPTPSDRSICNRLSFRFLPATLQELRDHQARTGERLFDGTHHLHRVAHRIHAQPKIVATSTENSKRSRLRWWYLLHQRLPSNTTDAINRVLQTAIDNTNVYKVTFDVTHTVPVTDFQLLPDNNSAPYVVTAGFGDARVIYQVILACPDDDYLPDPQSEHDPPDPDTNEQPVVPPFTPPPF